MITTGKGTVILNEFWMAYLVTISSYKHITKNVAVIAKVAVVSKYKVTKKVQNLG